MAFTSIDSEQIESGDAVTQELFTVIKDDLDDHESRIQDVEVSLATATIVGEIKGYGAAIPPTGWLLCDGSAVSRVTYAALFAVIGTAYGAGDGITTFNVPDARSRTLVGANPSGGGGLTARALGASFGAESDTHNHQWYNQNVAGTNDTSYDITGNETAITGAAPPAGENGISFSGGGGGVAQLNNDFFTSSRQINLWQPSFTAYFIIKT